MKTIKPKEVQALCNLFNEHKKWSKVASLLGKTPQAIRQLRWRYIDVEMTAKPKEWKL